MAALSRTATEKVKLKDSTQRYVIDPPYSRTRSNPLQTNVVSLAKGNQYTGEGAIQEPFFENFDSRLVKIRYPTNVGSYFIGGPGLTVKTESLEANRLDATTRPGFGKGMDFNDVSHTFFNNPKPRSNTQKNV